MKDLFGNETPNPITVPKHGFKRVKYIRRYRRSDDPLRRCKFCKHLVYTWPGARKFYKCKAIGITSSEATDIRLRNVCDLWDMEVKTVEQFETWYDANFFEGQECKHKIIKKVKELYENSHNNKGEGAGA